MVPDTVCTANVDSPEVIGIEILQSITPFGKRTAHGSPAVADEIASLPALTEAVPVPPAADQDVRLQDCQVPPIHSVPSKFQSTTLYACVTASVSCTIMAREVNSPAHNLKA